MSNLPYRFCLVATGPTYVTEAAQAIRSLRRYHANARVCLVTEDPRAVGPWDDLVILPRPTFGFRDKIAMRSCPYDSFVYLDTDVTIVAPMNELFEILVRFDACGVHMFEGQDYVIPGIPHAFPEMNGGVLGISKNVRTEVFFNLWEEYYDKFIEENVASYHYSNVGDQKSLRAALWYSELRFCCIGSEHNFIPFRTEFASLSVKAFHTRGTAGLAALESRLNSNLGRRAYVPRLDVVVGCSMSDQEIQRLLVASFIQWLRIHLRRFTPLFLRNGFRRFGFMRKLFIGNPHIGGVDVTDKWRTK